jgi:lipopolysaccharide exporter
MTDRTDDCPPASGASRDQPGPEKSSTVGADGEDGAGRPLARRAGSALFWKAFQLAGSKIVFLARTLILAWLLAPDDFGLLAIALIAVDTLSSLTDIGMIPALVQNRNADRRHYDTAWTVGIIRALIISVSVFVAAPFLAGLFQEPRAVNLIRLIALRPLFEAALSIRLAELIRELRFRSIAFVTLPDALANTLMSVALAPRLGVWAIVIGMLFGQMVQVVMSYLLAPGRPRFSVSRQAASSLVAFGRWIFLLGVLAILGNFLLQMIISRQLGAAELGLYFLACRLAYLPGEVAREVVGTIAFPVYAALQRDLIEAGKAFRSILTGVSAAMLPISALLIALAPSLVRNVLGPRWESTVPLIQVLALVNVIGLFGELVVPLLKGIGQPYKVVFLELAQQSILLVLVWHLAGRWGILAAAIAWVPALSVSQLLSLWFVRRIFPRLFAGWGLPLLTLLPVAGTTYLIAGVTTLMLPGLEGLFVATLLALGAASAFILILDRWLSMGLVEGVFRLFPEAAALIRLTPANR